VFPTASPFVIEGLHYEFPFYFYYYFRVSFLLCLVPFWVDLDFTEKTNLKLVTYRCQRTVCALGHITSFLYTIFDFRLQMAQSLKQRPGMIFDIACILCWDVYVILFAKVVWSKRLIKLLGHPLPRITHKVIINEMESFVFS